MEKAVSDLKKLVRAGRGLIPSDKVIINGQLVNVMTSETELLQ